MLRGLMNMYLEKLLSYISCSRNISHVTEDKNGKQHQIHAKSQTKLSIVFFSHLQTNCQDLKWCNFKGLTLLLNTEWASEVFWT